MTPGFASALILAGFMGLALGLLGSGGSIITVPVLIYVAGIPVSQAIAMALAIVAGTSLVGSIVQYKRGCLDLRCATLFSITGMIGAFAGAQFTQRVPAPILILLFSALMLALGVAMLGPTPDLDPTPNTLEIRPARCLALGGLVGALTGFLGVGGGLFIVPALTLFGGLSMKRAAGTSLGVIALNSLAGFTGQLRTSTLDWPKTAAFLAAATIGLAIGIAGSKRMPQPTLRRVFAYIVLGIAIVLACKNGWTLATQGMNTQSNISSLSDPFSL